jgi:hypothetical protein
MLSQHRVDAMARNREAKSAKKDRLIEGAIADQSEKDVGGYRPERTSARLAALTSQLHIANLAGGEVQILDSKRRSLRNASPGIVKEQQEGMIAQALLRPPVRGRQQSVHLRLVKIGEFIPGKSLERDGAYFATPSNVFRTAFSDESSHRMDCCEPLVPRANGALAHPFKMI